MRLLTFISRCLLLSIFIISHSISYSQTTGYSGTGANIDVKYHRFEWTLNASSKTVSGTVTTYFKTTQNNVSQITFDLSGNYNNTGLSVKYHGSTSGVTTTFPSTNVLRITIPAILELNTLDSVSITYSGTPPAFSTYGEGMDIKPATGLGSIAGLGSTIYTLAESYGDDDFWPCKADMQDKIDSIDFVITTPSSQLAAANGVLISNTEAGSNRTVVYKHRYPIASYLVAVAVASYTVYNRTPVTINGTSVPIVYYIGSGRTPTGAELTTMDYCRDQLVAFSNVYGDYPFKNEKYGMYEFGWGGGMEHQTFSAMSWGSMTSWSIVAHELAHQWFGDKVTFGTWNHLWLAEGFAKYSEALAAETVPAMGQNARTHRSGIKSTALSTSTTPIYLSNTNIANSNLIWTTANDDAVYQRGAMVVSMLRKLAGDTKFFQALRNYLNDPALSYKSATTQNLRDHFEAVLGYDLDAFFQDYIYGTGNPAYDISWGSNGNNINLELTTQRRSGSSTVSYFRTPVVLTIYNTGKTQSQKVVIYDQNGQVSYAGDGIYPTVAGKVLGYYLPFTPASVEVDPDFETLVRAQDGTGAQSTVTRVARLNVSPLVTLPIHILNFKGNSAPSGNLLSLLISKSTETKTIEVERSENGTQFYSLGKMEEGDAENEMTKYSFLDKDVFNKDVFYYRIKATDAESLVNYSKVISIGRNRNETSMKISPNPASRNVTIRWNGNISTESEITFYNGNGMQVFQKTFVGNIADVVISNLPAGIYSVVVKQKGKTVLTDQLIITK